MEDSERIRVTIYFTDGTQEEFYADRRKTIEENVAYWWVGDSFVSYPVFLIKKIVEK